MRGRNLGYRLYVGSALAVGAGVLAFTAADLLNDQVPLPSVWATGIWLCSMVLAAVASVPLPKQRATVRLSVVLEFAAILAYGPAIACWFSVIAQTIANGHRLKEPRVRLLLGQTALAVGTGGLMFHALGGGSGTAFVFDGQQGLVAVLAGAVYLLVHHAIANLASFLESLELIATKVSPLSHRLQWECMLLPFAIPLAMANTQVGFVSMGLIIVPLVLAWHFHSTWEDTKRGHLEAVRSLTSMIDAMDPFTRGHAYRIAKMSVAMGRRLGLSTLELEELEYAALLHDIGRTAIQHDILLKPGALNEEERSVLEMHPIIGRELLDRIGLMPAATEMVLYHHERPDGRGYPTGLFLEDIPLGSHIIMAVAAFDAMTSDRPYRRGLSPDAALDEMLAQAGKQFHSDVVEEFIQLYSSDELFAEFEPHVLADYANGECSSRALSVHLRRNALRHPQSKHTSAQADVIPEIIVDMDDNLDFSSRGPEKVLLSADGDWQLEVYAQTDTGQLRSNNEDSFGVFPHADESHGCLLVVADGMGGANAGEVASRIAVQTVRDAYFGDEDCSDDATALRDAISLANAAIFSHAAEEPQLAGMGTTCVAASIDGRALTIGHVGDSRAYLVTQGAIKRLTRDHNLAEELVHAVGGEAPSGSQHVLTRSLGNAAEVEVEVSTPVRLSSGDCIVLCSDGLSGVVETEEILHAIQAGSPKDACDHLIALANSRGGPDNITVGIARVIDSKD